LEYFAPILILVLPAGFLMGGGLPILDRIAINQVAHSGRRVGDIHLANITGSVSGTLVTSFILLPLLGSEITFQALSALTFTFLGFALLTRRATADRRLLIPVAGLLAAIFLLPGKGGFYTRLYQNATDRPSVAIHEGNDSVLAITFRDDNRDPTGLWIGGIQNSFFPSSGGYERSAMTCAAAVQPRRALIIGVGGGNTAMFLASLPELEELVIVELLEPLGGFLEEHVPIARTVLSQPHVRYIVDDGRRYLYANPGEKFDLIFIDPLWSFTAGHNNLYSREAMQLYKSHLTHGGVFCAWINEPNLIPSTAASVFEYSDHFSGYLVNSDQPLVYDSDYMTGVYDRYMSIASQHLSPAAAERLSPKNILESPREDRAATFLQNDQTPLLTDSTPWLEYYYLCNPKFIRALTLSQVRYCFQRP
jgi:spermidine synthase